MVTFLNATASSLPRSTAFEPTSTAIAINTLWFLSLVLSLSSALFGMLAKQWCREYLKWHSVLFPARDNILLRQMRYEAWQDWRIASHVAAIPALLELSLMLFFAGLVIYSWTLQHVVFAFVLAAVCLVLLAAISMTLLPTFLRRCPYKSPIGWAFSRLADSLRRRAASRPRGKLHMLLAKLLARRRSRAAKVFPAVAEELSEWRRWDMQVALDANLCGALPGLLRPKQSHGHKDADATIDAYQVSLLIRALSWVRRGSHDDKFVNTIDDCLLTVYDSMRSPARTSLHFHASVYAMRVAMGWTTSHAGVEAALSSQINLEPEGENSDTVVAIRLGANVHDRWTAQAGPYLTDTVSPVSIDKTLLALSRKAVIVLLRRSFDVWLEAQPSTGVKQLRRQDLRHALRITRLLCILRYVPRDYLDDAIGREGNDLDLWADTLVTAYSDVTRYRTAYSDGLIPMILELLRSMGTVTLSPDLTQCQVSRTSLRNTSSCSRH